MQRFQKRRRNKPPVVTMSFGIDKRLARIIRELGTEHKWGMSHVVNWMLVNALPNVLKPLNDDRVLLNGERGPGWQLPMHTVESLGLQEYLMPLDWTDWNHLDAIRPEYPGPKG